KEHQRITQLHRWHANSPARSAKSVATGSDTILPRLAPCAPIPYTYMTGTRMAPVTSVAVDQLVPATGQIVGLVITSLVTLAALTATLLFCYRRKIWWPLLIVVSGTMTFLLEPLYDHLFGLWFYEEGQW